MWDGRTREFIHFLLALLSSLHTRPGHSRPAVTLTRHRSFRPPGVANAAGRAPEIGPDEPAKARQNAPFRPRGLHPTREENGPHRSIKAHIGNKLV
jgi:hypothetical protein